MRQGTKTKVKCYKKLGAEKNNKNFKDMSSFLIL